MKGILYAKPKEPQFSFNMLISLTYIEHFSSFHKMF